MSQFEFNLTGVMAFLLLAVVIIALIAIALAVDFYKALKKSESENGRINDKNIALHNENIALKMACRESTLSREVKEALNGEK